MYNPPMNAQKLQSEVKDIFDLTYGADFPINADTVMGLISHHEDTIEDEDPNTVKRFREELKILRLWLKCCKVATSYLKT